MNIEFTGGIQKNFNALFSKTDMLTSTEILNIPILVLIPDHAMGNVFIETVRWFQTLLNEYTNPDIVCLYPWVGTKRTDYFRFTIGDLKEYLRATSDTKTG